MSCVFDFGKGFEPFKIAFDDIAPSHNAEDTMAQKLLGQELALAEALKKAQMELPPPKRRTHRTLGAFFPGTLIPMEETLDTYEDDTLLFRQITARALDVTTQAIQETRILYRRPLNPGGQFVLVERDELLIPCKTLENNPAFFAESPSALSPGPKLPAQSGRLLGPLATQRRIILE